MSGLKSGGHYTRHRHRFFTQENQKQQVKQFIENLEVKEAAVEASNKAFESKWESQALIDPHSEVIHELILLNNSEAVKLFDIFMYNASVTPYDDLKSLATSLREDPLGTVAEIGKSALINLIDPGASGVEAAEDIKLTAEQFMHANAEERAAMLGHYTGRALELTIPVKVAGLLGRFGVLGEANAAEGSESIAVKSDPLLEALSRALPTLGKSNQFEVTLDDGAKVLFRRDIGKYAHEIGLRYPKPVDHYNIEIQKPKPNRANRFTSVENMHIIVDQDLKPIDIFFNKLGEIYNESELYYRFKP